MLKGKMPIKTKSKHAANAQAIVIGLLHRNSKVWLKPCGSMRPVRAVPTLLCIEEGMSLT